jgi:hypothetical protein
MFSLDGETSLNLERGPFLASPFQISLPYRNEVMLHRPRPTVDAPKIPILVDHADVSLDGGSLAVCPSKHPRFPKCNREKV